jgi:hypothetical protein
LQRYIAPLSGNGWRLFIAQKSADMFPCRLFVPHGNASFDRRLGGGGTEAGCSSKLRLASVLVAKLDSWPILISMPKLPEVIFLSLIFLAIGVALMLFLGPILKMLGWPS